MILKVGSMTYYEMMPGPRSRRVIYTSTAENRFDSAE
jgi:hypothetical protein